jgi:spore maturation protein CgeB
VKVVLFCQSLLSNWNDECAHFHRGVLQDLQRRGHEVRALEPEGARGTSGLPGEAGRQALERLSATYPSLGCERYRADALDLDRVLDGANLVLVHASSEPALIDRLGQHRARSGRYALLLHDTREHDTRAHAEGASEDRTCSALAAFDGVLARSEALREWYDRLGFGSSAWTWHEAADVRVFRPHPELERTGDVVWVGNADEPSRVAELAQFLFEPVRRLELTSSVYGARHSSTARGLLQESGIEYRGWLPSVLVPEVFARYRATVYVPRRPARTLRHVPSIRLFEALACGIPVVSAPWLDIEQLFRPNIDFLVADSSDQVERQLRRVLEDRDLALALACAGLETLLTKHTCAHRVDELIDICGWLRVQGLDVGSPSPQLAPASPECHVSGMAPRVLEPQGWPG